MIFYIPHKQHVALNGQHSPWEYVYGGVPQSSTLGWSLLLIFINNLTKGMFLNSKLFADDASLFFSGQQHPIKPRYLWQSFNGNKQLGFSLENDFQSDI